MVEGVKGRSRPAHVLEFAVEVVLHDERALGPGPFEELEPAGQRQRAAQRVLVRRGHVGETRPRATAASFPYVQAFAVGGNRDEARPGARQRGAHAGVPGVLHPGGVAGLEEQAGHEVQALLRAGHHEHLIRVGVDTPRRSHVRGDGFAQGTVTLDVAVAEPLGGLAAEDGAGQPRPQRAWELLDGGHPRTEREPRVLGAGGRGGETAASGGEDHVCG